MKWILKKYFCLLKMENLYFTFYKINKKIFLFIFKQLFILSHS